MAQSPRTALIHATALAVEPINTAFKRLWPLARTTNLPRLACRGILSADDNPWCE